MLNFFVQRSPEGLPFPSFPPRRQTVQKLAHGVNELRSLIKRSLQGDFYGVILYGVISTKASLKSNLYKSIFRFVLKMLGLLLQKVHYILCIYYKYYFIKMQYLSKQAQ